MNSAIQNEAYEIDASKMKYACLAPPVIALGGQTCASSRWRRIPAEIDTAAAPATTTRGGGNGHDDRWLARKLILFD